MFLLIFVIQNIKTGGVNEKMQEMIINQILPRLLSEIAIKVTDEQLAQELDLLVFTLVFDRGISSPNFFAHLWLEYRVAILTYKKNVKDKWDDNDFVEHKVEIDNNKVKMDLCEKTIKWDNVEFREIRKKTALNIKQVLLQTIRN